MEKVNDIKLKKEIFDIEPNDNVVRDAIQVAMSGLRQGTYKVKTRSEVSGGGRKPWRQKGTGRARQGSIRAPQWRGGGVALGPVPRDYSLKMNRKERKLALKSALTYKARDKEIIVVDELSLDVPKTKEMLKLLESLELNNKKVLIVMHELNENIILAGRNLQNIFMMEPFELNVLDIINADYILADVAAIKDIEEALK
ncbi:MAG: 50S ribosomal protein L4 [Bacilli bacterium]|nr:50S ribosomal protein L4 [Bacilli bacterium]